MWVEAISEFHVSSFVVRKKKIGTDCNLKNSEIEVESVKSSFDCILEYFRLVTVSGSTPRWFKEGVMIITPSRNYQVKEFFLKRCSTVIFSNIYSTLEP